MTTDPYPFPMYEHTLTSEPAAEWIRDHDGNLVRLDAISIVDLRRSCEDSPEPDEVTAVVQVGAYGTTRCLYRGRDAQRWLGAFADAVGVLEVDPDGEIGGAGI